MNKPVQAEDFLALFSAPPEPLPEEKASTVGDDLGMSFEEFFSTYADDEGEGVFSNDSTQCDDLMQVKFPKIVLQTHERVRSMLLEQYTRKDGLKFLSDWTGRGKTTGIIKGLADLFLQHPDAKILIVTREMVEVDSLWRTLQQTLTGVSIVGYSGAHKGVADVEWEPVRTDVSKGEVKDAQIVISTHSSGINKKNAFLHKNRDLMLIDEYPDPVNTDIITIDEVAKVLDENRYGGEETQAAIKEAFKWIANLFHDRVTQDGWIDKLSASVTSKSEATNKLVQFGKMYRQGKGFIRSNGSSKSLVWAEFNLPMESSSIIFSATNAFEGWQIDPKRALLDKSGQPTDYSDLSVEFRAYPKGIKNTQNKSLMNTSQSIGLVKGAIDRAVYEASPDEKVLLLVPKTVADWLRQRPENEQLPDNVSLINWGSGIGTNAFMDCTHMVVMGLFHMASDKLAADCLGHGADVLTLLNNNAGTIKEARANHHSRWIIQMLNRTAIRKMSDGALKAAGAKVVWLTTPKDEVIATGVIGNEFLNATVIPAERVTAATIKEDVELVVDGFDVMCDELKALIKRQKGLGNKVRYALTWYSEKTDHKVVTSKELSGVFGIDFKQTKVNASLATTAKAISQLGWLYEPATRGKYGKPHTWTKIV